LPAVSAARVRMERAGTQRWLVVPQTAEKLWPLIKEFWQETGFLIKLEGLEYPCDSHCYSILTRQRKIIPHPNIYHDRVCLNLEHRFCTVELILNGLVYIINNPNFASVLSYRIRSIADIESALATASK